jgi:hypothetical protein
MIKLNFNTDTKIKVTLLNDGQKEVFSTYSTAFKTAYLFAKTMQDTYQVRLEYKNINGEQVTKIMEVKNDDLIEIDNVAVKQDMIDLMIVLDTTGSMNDEIKFLKAELMDICNKIKLANPNTILRLALLYYKDTKDEYITKYADFTTDIEKQINNLSSITASGGGDFEEAVEVAMSEASQKTWNEAATKILIHIADAPAHEKDITKWEEAISNIASLGINIITVAASGIDKLTEYYFRSEALLTSGAYVWLTDDSGVGESHTEATVETEVTIEYLNSLLIRLINGYHLGTLEEAIYWRQDV